MFLLDAESENSHGKTNNEKAVDEIISVGEKNESFDDITSRNRVNSSIDAVVEAAEAVDAVVEAETQLDDKAVKTEKIAKKEQIVGRKSTKKRRKNRPKENSRNNVYDDYPIYAEEIMIKFITNYIFQNALKSICF